MLGFLKTPRKPPMCNKFAKAIVVVPDLVSGIPAEASADATEAYEAAANAWGKADLIQSSVEESLATRHRQIAEASLVKAAEA